MDSFNRARKRISLTAGDWSAGVQHFFRSPMFPIFMIVFVDVLGFGITVPVLPLYAQGTFGASAFQIALFATVFFGAQFFASPQLGRLSDMIGRRPVLIISQMGTCLALILSGAAPSLLFIYVARAIDGFTGGNISVAQAYLNDITDHHNRARGLGVINAAFSAGFVFGPAFGAFMSATFGPRVPFFMAACVSLLTISLSTFLLPESLPPEHRQRRVSMQFVTSALGNTFSNFKLLAIPEVALMSAVAFGAQLAFFSWQTTFVLWAEKLVFAGHDPAYVEQTIGLMLALVGVFGIATQLWLVGPLVRSFGEKPMVLVGIGMRTLAWMVMALLPVFLPTLLVIPLMSMGAGLFMPALMALLTYVTPSHQRGQAIGLLVSAQNIGSIVGPIIAGQIFDHISPDAPMVMAAVVGALTVGLSLSVLRMQVKKSGAAAVALAD